MENSRVLGVAAKAVFCSGLLLLGSAGPGWNRETGASSRQPEANRRNAKAKVADELGRVKHRLLWQVGTDQPQGINLLRRLLVRYAVPGADKINPKYGLDVAIKQISALDKGLKEEIEYFQETYKDDVVRAGFEEFRALLTAGSGLLTRVNAAKALAKEVWGFLDPPSAKFYSQESIGVYQRAQSIFGGRDSLRSDIASAKTFVAGKGAELLAHLQQRIDEPGISPKEKKRAEAAKERVQEDIDLGNKRLDLSSKALEKSPFDLLTAQERVAASELSGHSAIRRDAVAALGRELPTLEYPPYVDRQALGSKLADAQAALAGAGTAWAKINNVFVPGTIPAEISGDDKAAAVAEGVLEAVRAVLSLREASNLLEKQKQAEPPTTNGDAPPRTKDGAPSTP